MIDKITKSVLLSWIWVMLLVGTFTSCSKDEEGVKFDYLVKYEQLPIFSKTTIQASFAILAGEYPEIQPLAANTGYDVAIYRITYNTHYRDSLIEASGLLCVPVADEAFPFISFQNATTTQHNKAPSVSPTNFDYLMVEGLAGNGYIIALPDYIGFGASEDILHPYYNKECTGDAIIDMMKACRELIGIKDILASENGTYFLMGYSQGGGSTLSVLDAIENGPDPGFDITAASCGAGAFDLMSMATYIAGQDTIPSALYLPYFIYSQQVYGTIHDDLSKFFNEPYAGRIPLLFDGSKSSSEINAQLTDTVENLLTPGFIAGVADGPDFTEIRTVLQQNSINAWNTDAAIRFYHGSADVHVPATQSADMAEAFWDTGVSTDQVKHFEFEGLTHDTSIIPWGIATFLWFNEMQ